MAPLSSPHPQTLRKIAWKSTRSKSASVMVESSAERLENRGSPEPSTEGPVMLSVINLDVHKNLAWRSSLFSFH